MAKEQKTNMQTTEPGSKLKFTRKTNFPQIWTTLGYEISSMATTKDFYS